MLISVVNFTQGAGRVSDLEALKYIRAVNRQILEDFAPYWHMQAELRLDEPVGKAPGDIHAPHPSLRGDGILYLVNRDANADYLGYHDKHNHGIPFAFVCTDLFDPKDEPWSVTLSHEALEMIADPEVNLLCRGPHPDSKKKHEVFHWFEMCDAVQSENYEVDGVRVSNFVLPLYFTHGDELSGRNDFLSLAGNGILKSFGVKKGGYVGFYDPDLDDDDTYMIDGDETAKERAETRMAISGRRRRDRRTEKEPAKAAAERVSAIAPPDQGAVIDTRTSGVQKFEGLYFRLKQRKNESEDMVYERAREKAQFLFQGSLVFDRFWKPEAPAPLENEFLAKADKDNKITINEAWDCVHKFAEDKDVLEVEPLFQVLREDFEPDPMARRAAGRQDQAPDPKTDDHLWSLKQVKALGLPKRGKDILIGHPDTGYTDHAQIKDAVMADKGYDFWDNDPNPKDDLESAEILNKRVDNPGHGTGTGSVIVGRYVPTETGDGIQGTAPEATLIPFRVSSRVVLLSMSALALAIRKAADAGCHVISISMGGMFSIALRQAVDYAVGKGVIVLAAAGNEVRFVVWPARFEKVIAVAASNVDRGPWSGSCRGPDVDITAPGQAVWRARTRRKDEEEFTMDLERGSGTSFAVATVAGIAASWVEKHGHQALKDKYGAKEIASVFKRLLMETAQKDHTLPDGFGAGIADAEALLAAALPEGAPARGMRRYSGGLPGNRPLDRISHVLPDLSPSEVAQALSAYMGVAAGKLEEEFEGSVGNEMAFHAENDLQVRAEIMAAGEVRPGLRRGMHTQGGGRKALNTVASRRLLDRVKSERKTVETPVPVERTEA